MSNVVRYARRGDVGTIIVDSPPVNALGQAVRAGLLQALAQGHADAHVQILVLAASGRTFMAGADIREFGKPPQLPPLSEVVVALEASAKPVIAAIHGTALGGGLEVALGCAYRVSTPTARFGLPEVKLGLLPGAGGTQRLPRLIGVPEALEMIVTGEPVAADRALQLGLVDAVEDVDDAAEAGLRLAQRVRGATSPVPVSKRTEKLQGVPPALFDDARARLAGSARGLFSPQRCVDAVQAAVTMPFADGLRRERELFLECMASPQRAGLIHSFLAEREVAKVPGLPADVRPREIRTVAVIGAGTMGGGIAMCFANAAIPVRLLEVEQAVLDKGLAVIRANYQNTVAKGRLAAAEAQRRMECIRPSLSYEDLRDVDLVIEAVFEDLALKQEIFRKLDRVCKPEAILATNTSTLDVNLIASATRRPESVVGTHFFSPANVMKLLENVRGSRTSADIVATVMALSKRIGKVGVVVGVCYGFVGNRMLHQRATEAIALVNEGASPQQVDRVLTDFGFAMGHFAMSDLAGNDVGWRIREGRRKAQDPDAPARNWQDTLVEQGRLGQKTNAGVFRYEKGSRKPLPDPEVDALIASYRAEAGIKPRTVSDEEILERCLTVMVNEGAKILEEGIAARSRDIDVIWQYGYGFPAYRGGPMFWADQLGLTSVYATVQRYHRQVGGKQWRPSELLARLSREGKTFTTA